MFEVTDIRKYNHTMSKLYVAHGIVFILPGLPLLAGHCCGSCSGNHCLMAVYSLVIKKKYKSNFDRSIVWDET